MRLRRCVALLAGALLATGCGGGGGEGGGSGAGPAVAGTPISFEELARSASTSAEATSARFAFSMSATPPGTDEPFALSAEGAFDAVSRRASLSVDMSSFASMLGGLFHGLAGGNAPDAPDFDDPEGWRIQVVRNGSVGYVRFPALDDRLPSGKSWVRSGQRSGGSRGSDFSELEQSTRADPRELLGSLRAISRKIETVGVEELRGAETTHYRGTIDVDAYARRAPAERGQALETLLDQIPALSGPDEIPVDVWLDARGLVRKLTMTLQPGGSDSGELSIGFEIWDYGENVHIELPPASEVVDVSAVGS